MPLFFPCILSVPDRGKTLNPGDMRSIRLLVLLTPFTHTLLAQIKFDVDGDARILERRQLQPGINDQSVFLGTGTSLNDHGDQPEKTTFFFQT